MGAAAGWFVVGLDNGGTANNATVLDASGRFLVDRLVETASMVQEGPDVAIGALVKAFEHVLGVTGTPAASVRAVGLDTPGPASANGVISSRGSTNFAHPGWRGFDVRGALEARLGLPVAYNNDANAAALYAHHATPRAVTRAPCWHAEPARMHLGRSDPNVLKGWFDADAIRGGRGARPHQAACAPYAGAAGRR